MSDIVESAQKMSGLITDIAQASREQSDGIDQINQAMAQMEDVTQQNAAIVEESAAAEGLASRAEDMVSAMSRFRVADGGKPAAGKGAVSRAQTAPAQDIRSIGERSRSALPPRQREALPRPGVAREEEWKAF